MDPRGFASLYEWAVAHARARQAAEQAAAQQKYRQYVAGQVADVQPGVTGSPTRLADPLEHPDATTQTANFQQEMGQRAAAPPQASDPWTFAQMMDMIMKPAETENWRMGYAPPPTVNGKPVKK